MNVVGKQVEGKRVNTVAMDEGFLLTVERIQAGVWMTTNVGGLTREDLTRRDKHVVLLCDLFVNGNEIIREALVNKLRAISLRSVQ